MHSKYAELCELRRQLAHLTIAASKESGPTPLVPPLNPSPALERTMIYDELTTAAAQIDRAAESSTDLTSELGDTAWAMEDAEKQLGGNDPAVAIMKRIRSLAASGRNSRGEVF